MKVIMGRKINVFQYETLDLNVVISTGDFPRDPAETPDQHLHRLQEKAYKEILTLEVLHKRRTVQGARDEFARFQTTHKEVWNDQP